MAEVAAARGKTADADLYSTCLDEYERGMEAARIGKRHERQPQK